MANIPTLSTLYTSVLTNLESELNITIPLIGKNFLRALAAVQAAKLKLYYLAIANLQKNVFVDTAESEFLGGTLERFGRVKLGRNPFPASPGSYEVEVTGNVGGIIAVNTTFKSNDDALNAGKMFILDNQYTIVGGQNLIILRSLEAGLDSKLSVGDKLTATAPIANVDSLCTVTAETIEPFAAEDLEVYRERCIEAFQLEPQGGAATDYRLWASDAQGVQKVYPYAKTGYSNELEIYVEATIADSTDGKGTPSASLLSDVADVIEFDPDTLKPLNERGRRPLGVFNIDFLPTTVKEIDIVITGYYGLTPANEVSIFNALEEALNNVRPYVAACDTLESKNDIFSTFNAIFTIQKAVPGSIFTSVDLQVDSVSVASFLFDKGNIPHLNSVTYV